MDKNKQTAVEWLKEMLIDNKYLSKDAEHLFEEAIEIERDQIMIASSHSHFEGGNYKMSGLELFEYGFKYYTSTYGQ